MLIEPRSLEGEVVTQQPLTDVSTFACYATENIEGTHSIEITIIASGVGGGTGVLHLQSRHLQNSCSII
jgi:hypothetical protein